MKYLPLIGISSCLWHYDQSRVLFNGRPLYYWERSMGQYFLDEGLPCMLLPDVRGSRVKVQELIKKIDALVLHGGVDMAPESYGEEPLRAEWAGDQIRDQYEFSLLEEALNQGKPVLAICRGLQVLNVFFGGTLYQDISTQCTNALIHRDAEMYAQNEHHIEVVRDSFLAKLYPELHGRVNSVHHQGIKTLGEGLTVQATCSEDGIIEAVFKPPFCLGVQWHPEFQRAEDTHLLSPIPILNSLKDAI